MLRFVNSHRLASVGLAAAAVVLLAAMAGGFDRHSTATPSTTSQLAVSSMTPATTSRPDTGVTAKEPAATTDPVTPTAEESRTARLDRSRRGAKQTAIDYASTVQQQLLYLGSDDARSLLDSWSADRHSDELDRDLAELGELRSALRAGGGLVWWSVSPIAANLEAIADDRARVSVWVVQVVGSDVDPMRGGESFAPTADFSTTSIELVWDGNRGWTVWDASSTRGPVPMMSAISTMSSPSEFFESVGSFTLVKEHS